MITLFVAAFLVTFASPAKAQGDGNLQKRSVEETCHACHKTDSNAPSDPNAIKTHNSANTVSTKWGGNWGVAGGKYGPIVCTTCHTAHSTRNVYLINEMVKTPDGTSWASSNSSTVNVHFEKKSGNPGDIGLLGDDSASTVPRTSSQKVCEACHSQTSYHKYNQSALYSHETAAGVSDCTTCHSHKGGFAAIGGCTICHSRPQGNRAAVVGQFSNNSHHIQGAAVTDQQCYQCHWEANSNGTVNTAYHGGAINPGAPVKLVIYGSGVRPSTYTAGATAVEYLANGSRSEMQKINLVCLGCHSAQNNATQPFGDGKTPNQYAWDGLSVNDKYSQTGTTPWGKYSGANVTPKNTQTKAFSAHGNAINNQGGWDLNETWPNMRNGSVNVLCFDCHNSHGSSVTGTTTSYTSSTANGGMLKDTVAGQGGYSMTYQPQAGGSVANKNVRNAGASLCLDCHLTASGGTTQPWGYNSTFGESQQIIGYWDSSLLAPGNAGPQLRYEYKGSAILLNNAGGHFGASSDLTPPPDSSHQINGLCTPCHDPHGVSPTLGANMNYGVPMLKGTWLTSPYKEDVAPATNAPGTTKTGAELYHIDQNTFGTDVRVPVTGITEADTQFAGLCLNCHPRTTLTDGVTHTWKDKNRIHESVKGWKTADATIKHNYSCSKCHATHMGSALPRLMVTNCLNSSHKGRMGYDAVAVTSGSGSGTWDGTNVVCYGLSSYFGYCGTRFPSGGGSGAGQMPGSWNGSNPGNYLVTCHEANAADQSWNVKTPWVEDNPVINSGPTAGSFTAVGSNVQATIIWQTSNSYTSSYVDYGLTPSYGSTTGNSTLVLNHSVVLQNLIDFSTYHYQVRSTGGLGNTVTSGDNTFYISVPPTVPTLIHQANAICSSNCSVTLQWNASTDPVSGPIQYNVQVSTDATFATVNYTSGWVSGTSVTTSLSTNNAYYWRVQARDANHTTAQDPPSAWSLTDSFLISDGIAPPQVTLISPANGTTFYVGGTYCPSSINIVFSWNAAKPFAQYYVEVCTNNLPLCSPAIAASGWISATSWTFNGFSSLGTWFWRVQARDPVTLATGPWSSPWLFTVTDATCY